jgi:hypothetical protein
MESLRGQHDDEWRAGSCAGAFLGTALLLDWGSGGLTLARAVLWTALALGLFAVLLPSRVVAGKDRLAVHGLVRTQKVRTDALVGVWQSGEVTVRLVLRDAYGGRVEIDPRVLVADPLLWHLVDTGARRSREHGTLRYGSPVLRELGERVDGDTARAIFLASGLR